jgi:pyridinium-3,5-bisthiocarboxylic acid mononucleotide nickel chelatase
VRVAHFDCFSGISGDMVLGAIIDAGVNPDAIRAALNSLGLPIQLEVEKVKRCGFAATKATIHAEDQEDYRFLPDVEAILAKANLTTHQRALATTIFQKVALAESVAHGMPLERVHFHEVGALDSIADIVGSAVGLDLLGVKRFTSSPVAVGSGTVRCAHGIMPVPTPGTAELLKGVPITSCPVKGELATPTGVAILTSVVTEFQLTPTMTIESIGHGAGTKDPIEQPNLLRLLVGTSEGGLADQDTVTILETNLDDCSPEIIGYLFERLLGAGACDVFTVPIQMKKNRPGVLLTVICEAQTVGRLETILFQESATFGIRRTVAQRTKLLRETIQVTTKWGNLRAKRGYRLDGFQVVTPEYEECAKVAREHNVPLREVYEEVRKVSR